MKVYWIAGPAAKTVQVPGPADLPSRPDKVSGDVILRGQPSEADLSRWSHALGLFALRGGRVHWGWV